MVAPMFSLMELATRVRAIMDEVQAAGLDPHEVEVMHGAGDEYGHSGESILDVRTIEIDDAPGYQAHLRSGGKREISVIVILPEKEGA